MSIVRECRQALGLSQTQLAQRCGLSRQFLVRVERGLALPSLEVAQRLEAALGCGPIVSTAHLLSEREWRRDVCPYEFPVVNPACWRMALEDWPYPIGLLQIPERTTRWMESTLACESKLEAYAFFQIAKFDCLPQVSSPHSLGFRGLPIVDALGRVLGERLLPGLRGHLKDLHFLLWPQVRLKPGRVPFRTDALVLLRRRRNSLWCILEIDGFGHDPDRDESRTKWLALKDIRLSKYQVENHQAGATFITQARDKLGGVTPRS